MYIFKHKTYCCWWIKSSVYIYQKQATSTNKSWTAHIKIFSLVQVQEDALGGIYSSLNGRKKNTINAAKSQIYVVILMMKITKSILQPVVSFNKVSWGKLNLFSGSWGYPLITAFKINRSFREACISNSWLQCIFQVLSLLGKQMVLKKW